MNKKLKHSMLAVLLTSVIATPVFAAKTISSSPLIGSKIEGYRPYMEAIGTKIVAGGIADPDRPGYMIPQVGSVIEVPTYATADALFKFADKDSDIVAQLGKQFGIKDGSSVQGNIEFEIKWFEITPKAGKKFPDQTGAGTDVTSWDDLDATEIAGEFYGTNTNSKSLIVPETALGKRLGFIAIPTSEYGVPNKGTEIRAWDLSKVWEQKAPTLPGDCEVGSTDPNCDGNGNPIPGPEGENPGGGGGDVGSADYMIVIYDGVTNAPIKAGDKLAVDKEYYATIRIKNTDNTFRDPTTTELKTLKWNIVDTNDASKVLASYDSTDTGRVNNDSGKMGPGNLKAYTFKTQTTNLDAKDPLGNTAPNYSEQGFSLQVLLDIE